MMNYLIELDDVYFQNQFLGGETIIDILGHMLDKQYKYSYSNR